MRGAGAGCTERGAGACCCGAIRMGALRTGAGLLKLEPLGTARLGWVRGCHGEFGERTTGAVRAGVGV